MIFEMLVLLYIIRKCCMCEGFQVTTIPGLGWISSGNLGYICEHLCFRMVSCGWDNIRLWRVRNGTLRSCPVDLGEYRSMDFTDVAFKEDSSDPGHDNLTL